MDAATIKDIITLSVSMTALAITIVLANRQIRLARSVCRDTNSTKALLALNAEYRTDEFRRCEDFVLHHLATEHKTGLGVYFSYLENLAYVAAGTDKRELLDRQGLRQIDGSRWVSPPPPRSRRSWIPDVPRRLPRGFSQPS